MEKKLLKLLTYFFLFFSLILDGCYDDDYYLSKYDEYNYKSKTWVVKVKEIDKDEKMDEYKKLINIIINDNYNTNNYNIDLKLNKSLVDSYNSDEIKENIIKLYYLKSFFDDFREQINAYTRKITATPWSFGCGNKALVIYILHDPYIKFAVQYLENHKKVKNIDTNKTFDEMVENPQTFKDEYHNCLVTFFRLLLKTYEELEKSNTDSSEHGVLWNQIQGLEYLSHFLCGTFRRGWSENKKFTVAHELLRKILNIEDIASLKNFVSYFNPQEEIEKNLENDDDNDNNNLINKEEIKSFDILNDIKKGLTGRISTGKKKLFEKKYYNYYIHGDRHFYFLSGNNLNNKSEIFIHDCCYQFLYANNKGNVFGKMDVNHIIEKLTKKNTSHIDSIMISDEYYSIVKDNSDRKIDVNPYEEVSIFWENCIPFLSSKTEKIEEAFKFAKKEIENFIEEIQENKTDEFNDDKIHFVRYYIDKFIDAIDNCSGTFNQLMNNNYDEENNNKINHEENNNEINHEENNNEINHEENNNEIIPEENNNKIIPPEEIEIYKSDELGMYIVINTLYNGKEGALKEDIEVLANEYNNSIDEYFKNKLNRQGRSKIKITKNIQNKERYIFKINNNEDFFEIIKKFSEIEKDTIKSYIKKFNKQCKGKISEFYNFLKKLLKIYEENNEYPEGALKNEHFTICFKRFMIRYFKDKNDFNYNNLASTRNTSSEEYSYYFNFKNLGFYNKADVLKVDWDKTGLDINEDLPIFREKFGEYELFGSTKF